MIDTTGFTIINNLAGNSIILDKFFVAITHYGIFLILGLILMTKNKKIITQAILALILALFIDQIINLIIYRPRPFNIMNVTLLVSSLSSSSFPSTHTLISFAPATMLFLRNKLLGKYALFIAGFVGISRIYVGVHYPTDIIAGIIIGVVASLTIYYGWEKLNKQFSSII